MRVYTPQQFAILVEEGREKWKEKKALVVHEFSKPLTHWLSRLNKGNFLWERAILGRFTEITTSAKEFYSITTLMLHFYYIAPFFK